MQSSATGSSDGYLAVIEFKKIEGPSGPPIKIRLSEDDTENMVTIHGFRKIKTVLMLMSF